MRRRAVGKNDAHLLRGLFCRQRRAVHSADEHQRCREVT
jgi:hypothetical protein